MRYLPRHKRLQSRKLHNRKERQIIWRRRKRTVPRNNKHNRLHIRRKSLGEDKSVAFQAQFEYPTCKIAYVKYLSLCKRPANNNSFEVGNVYMMAATKEKFLKDMQLGMEMYIYYCLQHNMWSESMHDGHNHQKNCLRRNTILMYNT